MIRYNNKERTNMMNLLELEQEDIKRLRDERAELEEKLETLNDKIVDLETNRDLVQELYGITYNYIEGKYELDQDYMEASD